MLESAYINTLLNDLVENLRNQGLLPDPALLRTLLPCNTRFPLYSLLSILYSILYFYVPLVNNTDLDTFIVFPAAQQDIIRRIIDILENLNDSVQDLQDNFDINVRIILYR